MSETTPVFGIPYPCANEVLTSEHFRDFALAVDDACSALAELSETALHRPVARIENSATDLYVIFLAGVSTQITFDTVYADNNGMVDLGTNSLVAQTAGLYKVSVGSRDLNLGGAGPTNILLEIRKNGVAVYGRRFPAQTVGEPVGWNIAGLVELDVGDLVTFTATIDVFSASLGFHTMSAHLVCRL